MKTTKNPWKLPEMPTRAGANVYSHLLGVKIKLGNHRIATIQQVANRCPSKVVVGVVARLHSWGTISKTNQTSLKTNSNQSQTSVNTPSQAGKAAERTSIKLTQLKREINACPKVNNLQNKSLHRSPNNTFLWTKKKKRRSKSRFRRLSNKKKRVLCRPKTW